MEKGAGRSERGDLGLLWWLGGCYGVVKYDFSFLLGLLSTELDDKNSQKP
ncbi:hypothetical protein GF319_05965 [Candidatus Bathyarchaeota archaeon]|nr:hypothetical protein [Candidatus Bathyarchaeota archaeon]